MKFAAYFIVGALLTLTASAADSKPNLLIITTDDMSCDSVGVYGCRLPDTTPQMDRLAGQSLRFLHAFVQVGNCMPSRNVMWSGRYPHNNRVEGFYQIKDPDYPHLSDLMKAAGYFTGIRGKISHSTPYTPYPAWDAILDTLPDGKPAHGKDANSYYLSTQGTVTYRRMKALAPDNPEIASRLKLIDHRVPEELYQYAYDDAALTNLIGKAEHQTVQNQLTEKLEAWMVQSKDPLLEVFRNRHDPAAREAFMQSARQEASQRPQRKKESKGKGKAKPTSQATRTAAPKGDHLTLELPASASIGIPFTVRVIHTLHDDLGPQKLHVTLKQRDHKRIERQVLEVKGNDTAEITFHLPDDLATSAIITAAFLGDDIQSALQHIQSQPIPLTSKD